MQSFVRRAALSAGLIAALVLSGCVSAPAESSDTPSTPEETVSVPTTAPTADETSVGFLPLDPPEKRQRADGDLYTFSPYYADRLKPRGDYGAILCYAGQSARLDDGEDTCEIYGLTDSALRVLTPAIYSSCELRDGVWFLIGNTPRTEDNPRIAKMYGRSPQLRDLFRQTVLASKDGSIVLDDGYICYDMFAGGGGGYFLFRADGSLTVVDRQLHRIAELSGGDYCWVQSDDDGELFAFHGLDGSVTVRDRTGKTLAAFTRAQIGCDAGYQWRAGIAPATKIFWYKGVGYVTHYDDDAQKTTVSRFLFVDTGEVRTPPLSGYVSESDEYPTVPEKVFEQSYPELPSGLPEQGLYYRNYEPFTGKAVFVAEVERDGKKLLAAYDGDGKQIGPVLPLEGYPYVNVYGDYLCVICPGGRDEAAVTTYYRLTDGECVFRYTAQIAG